MEIRKIKDSEINEFVEIQLNAYPKENLTNEQKEKTVASYDGFRKKASEIAEFVALFDEGIMKGCMILYRYRMNVRYSMINAGGIGSVAVHTLYRKEKVCRHLIEYAHTYFSGKGIHLSFLYPFRTDFYYKMGYGFGTRKDRYEISPAAFPNGGNKKNIEFLKKDEINLMIDSYNKFMKSKNGLCIKYTQEFERYFGNPAFNIIGFKNNGKIDAYCIYKFVSASKNNFIKNNIEIIRLVYNTKNAFNGVMEYFRSLADQINRIIINTQDDMLYHAFIDPRDGSDYIIPSVYHKIGCTGVGVMYRVVDFKEFFEETIGYFDKKNLTIKMTLKDDFIEKNDGIFYIDFDSKLVSSEGENYDYHLKTDIQTISSILMGAFDMRSAVEMGKIEIDNEEGLNTLQNLFYIAKPLCMEDF